MSARIIRACLCVLACSLAGDSGGNAWESPDSATLRYLEELLKKNHPGITDDGVRISCSKFPVEVLLEEEILEPRFGFPTKKNVLISCLFQFPMECKYLSPTRKDDYEDFLMNYSEVSAKTVRAHATIFEFNQINDQSVGVVITNIEAEFHDQCDVNRDGKWDLQSCWTVVKSKDTTARTIWPAARKRALGGNDKGLSDPMKD